MDYSFPLKLWIYTNFDCNLSCRYCVAESTPRAPRRALGLATVKRLADEAAALGFERLFLTGGEPLIIDDVGAMLAYTTSRLPTTLLTNAMLLRGKRWQRLEEAHAGSNGNLVVQVSLDGATPAQHDPYRGAGTWQKTMAGLERLLAAGYHVCVSTTETTTNSNYLDEIRAFVAGLGIAETDHLVRPLARRGFSDEGMEVGTATLVPEITITADGAYWHPLISPRSDDMQLCAGIPPLAEVVALVSDRLAAQDSAREEFT